MKTFRLEFDLFKLNLFTYRWLLPNGNNMFAIQKAGAVTVVISCRRKCDWNGNNLYGRKFAELIKLFLVSVFCSCFHCLCKCLFVCSDLDL